MKKLIIASIIILFLVFSSLYYVFDKKLENKRLEGFNLGVYQVALEQTKNSVLLYIDQNKTLNLVSLQELCGNEDR